MTPIIGVYVLGRAVAAESDAVLRPDSDPVARSMAGHSVLPSNVRDTQSKPPRLAFWAKPDAPRHDKLTAGDPRHTRASTVPRGRLTVVATSFLGRVAPLQSSEREDERLDSRVGELDAEQPVLNRSRLADELVHALIVG
jgi:hypothetical protein